MKQSSKLEYEYFEHTADIGIRAIAKTPEDLFIAIAQGLANLLVDEPNINTRISKKVDLSANGIEQLLVAWLSEIIFLFATKHFIPVEYRLNIINNTTLQGEIKGEIFDPDKHTPGREVKAITQHLLEVKQRQNNWCAQVIVDI